jgi:hypothetical protein
VTTLVPTATKRPVSARRWAATFRQRHTQLGRHRFDLLAVEVKVAVDLDVGHYDREHLL